MQAKERGSAKKGKAHLRMRMPWPGWCCCPLYATLWLDPAAPPEAQRPQEAPRARPLLSKFHGAYAGSLRAKVCIHKASCGQERAGAYERVLMLHAGSRTSFGASELRSPATAPGTALSFGVSKFPPCSCCRCLESTRGRGVVVFLARHGGRCERAGAHERVLMLHAGSRTSFGASDMLSSILSSDERGGAS